MSTDYVTRRPTTLERFKAKAHVAGWRDGVNQDGGYALVGTSGHYAHDIGEVKSPSGQIHVMFTRYGQNWAVAELAEELDCVDEHDEEAFLSIVGDCSE